MTDPTKEGGGPEGPGAPEIIPPPATVEDFRRQVQELEKRVKAAQAAKEEDIQKRLGEHDLLVAELTRIRELLPQAEQTSFHFSDVQQRGLVDKKDQDWVAAEIEKIGGIINSLRTRESEIILKTRGISELPEVRDRMIESAEAEDKKRTIEKIVAEAHAELDPQIDALAEGIKKLAEEYANLDVRSAEDQRNRGMAVIRDIITGQLDNLKKKDHNSAYLIEEDWRQSQTGKDLRKKLEKRMEKLSWFKRSAKAALDFILSKKREWNELIAREDDLSFVRERSGNYRAGIDALSERYRAIIAKAFDEQERIIEFQKIEFQKQEQPFPYLPSKLNERLAHVLEDYADIRRFRGEREIPGKYKDWGDAGKASPEYATLCSILDRVKGGVNLYTKPKTPEKQS